MANFPKKLLAKLNTRPGLPFRVNASNQGLTKRGKYAVDSGIVQKSGRLDGTDTISLLGRLTHLEDKALGNKTFGKICHC